MSNKQTLLKELDDLKLIFQVPRLYLSNYFSSLRTKVDIAFTKKQFEEADSQSQVTTAENWNKMIEQINLFEYDCLAAQKSNKFCDAFNKEINEKISLIESTLACESMDDYEKIEQLIYETKFMIEKKVFMNETITYLDRDICSFNSSLFNSLNIQCTVGKLLHIKNDYLGEKMIESLKRNEKISQLRKLENETVKLKQIELKIETSDKQIDEIYLDLGSFKTIFLSYSGLKFINNNSFNGFNNLNAMYLGHNNLIEIDRNLFKDLENLSILDLCWNQLTNLNKNVFNGLKNLKHLFLHGNKLKEIDKTSFKELTSLKSITLFQNQLKKIDHEIFIGLKDLRRIEMHKNDFKCNKLELNLEKNVCFVSFKMSLKNDIGSIISPAKDSGRISGVKSSVCDGCCIS